MAQILTAGVLLWALYRPLRRRSLFPGWRADVRWRVPSPQSALTFVGYAGPIAGVLITKVIIYGEPADVSIPTLHCSMRAQPDCLPPARDLSPQEADMWLCEHGQLDLQYER